MRDDFMQNWNRTMAKYTRHDKIPSAYSNRDGHYKNFNNYMRTPFSTTHWNKGNIPNVNHEDLIGKFEETDSFECSGSAESVSAIAYDRNKMLMLVTWKNARTGTNGGLPAGTRTIYERIPEYIYERLKSKAQNTGHCGDLLWSLVRVYGDQQSAKSYANIGD